MDPDKVRGNIQRPYNQQEPEPSDKIDPEKFKKVMKVEDTDEAQKRNKRNLKREEEEGEDEEIDKNAPTPPTAGAFSELMSDKDELDNVLGKESGGVRYQAAPQEGESFIAPKAGSIDTEGVELDEEEPQAQPPQGQEQAPQPQAKPPSPQEEPTPPETPQPGGETWQPPIEPPIYEGGKDQPQQQPSEIDEAPSAEQQQQPEEAPQETAQQPSPKKKEEDTSLLASQPKLADIKPKKKKKTAGPAPEIKTLPDGMQPAKKDQKPKEDVPADLEAPPSTKPEKKAPPPLVEGAEKTEEMPTPSLGALPEGEEIAASGVPSSRKTTKAASPFLRLSPQEVRNQRLGKAGEAATSAIEGIVVPSLGEGEQGEMGEGKKEKEHDALTFLEANPDTASIALPTFEAPLAPVAPTAPTPSYTRLTPEVHELFERMGGVMTIQVDKGVTTTTMDINMPNSVFNGSQIILDHYSAAPHSYNLQLVGSPEAVKVFNQNLKDLTNSFKQANFNFEVNILSPSISQTKKSPHLIRRKGSAGGKQGGGGKKK